MCFLVSFLVLFLVIALRDHVGTDYDLYANTYLAINSGGEVDISWVGPVYIALNRLAGIFAPRDYELFFALVGFLTMYFLYKAIYRMSCCWWLSLYIFICFCFYYQTFNQFRQALAMSVTTYACYFLFNDKTKKLFLFWVAVAVLIHRTAVVMFILYPCCKIPVNRRNLMIYAIAFAFLYLVFNVLWSMLPAILPNVNAGHYGTYVRSQENIPVLAAFNTLVRFSMLAGCLLFAGRTIKRNPNCVIYYNAAIICFMMTALTLKAHVISRATSYFYLLYIFLVPEVLKSIQSYLRRADKMIMTLLTFLLFLAYHFVYYFNPSSIASGYGEYKMMFFQF